MPLPSPDRMGQTPSINRVFAQDSSFSKEVEYFHVNRDRCACPASSGIRRSQLRANRPYALPHRSFLWNTEATEPTMNTTFSQRMQHILRSAAILLVVTVCGLAAGGTAGILAVAIGSHLAPGTRDYIVYWATAQQLAHHANPYDVTEITRLERGEGLPPSYKIGLMRNPPLAFPLVYPLEFLGARTGWMLWYTLLLLCIALSVWLIWFVNGKPRGNRYLLGLAFAPALVSAISGQTSLLMLPGLVLFLRLHRTRPFLAGVSLGIFALKPHLFVPFALVLVAWVVLTKSYRILAGAAAAVAAACALSFSLDPLAWSQYAQMVRTSKMVEQTIPCVSYLLRDWLYPRSTAMLFLPAVLGSLWALTYFWQRRQHWDWLRDGGLLMLVSILTAPYAWIYDQGMVLPALMYAAFRCRSRNLLILLAVLSALVEISLFISLHDSAFLNKWTYWTAPAWLLWYLAATRTTRSQQPVE